MFAGLGWRHINSEMSIHGPWYNMKRLIFALFTSLSTSVVAHDHSSQIPLDYVKYPYQAVYPGSNEGMPHADDELVVHSQFLSSYCGLRFLWHQWVMGFCLQLRFTFISSYFCQTSLGSMPQSR